MKYHVNLLSFFIFSFLSVNFIHFPLLAMDTEKEFRTHQRPIKPVIVESLRKVVLGAGLMYVGSQTEENNDSSQSDLKFVGKHITYCIGFQFVASSIYDVVSCLYENWRSNSIEQDIEKLKGTSYNTKKGKINAKKINEKRVINVRKEWLNYISHLNCGMDIAQASFVCWHTYCIINRDHDAYNSKFALFDSDEEINLIRFTMLPILVNCGWSLNSLRKHWGGESFEQDVPLKSFLRALSSYMTSRICAYKTNEYVSEYSEYLIKSPKEYSKFVKAFDDATSAGSIKNTYADIDAFLSKYIMDKFYKYLMIRNFLLKNMDLQIGKSIFHFFEGCKELYDERNYWFGLVDDLSETKSRPQKSSQSTAPVQDSSSYEKDTVEQTLIDEKKTDQAKSLEYRQKKEDAYDDLILPKTQKKKTRGVPNKHIDSSIKSSNLQPSTNIEYLNKIAHDDQIRKDALDNIQVLRLTNSVPKRDIKTMSAKAARFAKGTVSKDGHKFVISWIRRELPRSVKFENNHKQKNEKASIFKGHKLKMALDALEQVYLDGWDKENILSHLNGRFKLYYLPYECMKVLWTSHEKNGDK